MKIKVGYECTSISSKRRPLKKIITSGFQQHYNSRTYRTLKYVSRNAGSLVFAMFWLILGCGFLPQPAVAQKTVSDSAYPLQLSEEWEYRWGDAPVDSSGVPTWTFGEGARTGWRRTSKTSSPEGEPRDFLWLRTRLPDLLPDRPIITIPQLVLHVEVFVDSTSIYQYGDMRPRRGIKYASSVPHTISIPDDAGGKILSLRIFSQYHRTIGIPGGFVYLLPESALIRFAAGGNMVEFLIGIVFFFIGLLVLLILFKEKDRSNRLMLLFFSEFLLSVSLLYIGSNFISRLMIPRPVLWYYMTMAFLFFPVGLLGFFEQVIGSGYKSIVRWLWIGMLIFGIAALLLDITNIVPVYEMIYLYFGILAVVLVIMIFTIIPEVRTGSFEARVFGIGSLVTIGTGLHDTLALGLQLMPDQPGLSPWGFVFFCAFPWVFVGVSIQQKRTAVTRVFEGSGTTVQ